MLAYAHPDSPLYWMRRGDGIAGIGTALRWELNGSPEGERMPRAPRFAARWRELAAASTVDDEVALPGTGLVGFGAFSFDDRSDRTSVLIVPRVIVGRRAGRSWITRIEVEGAEPGERARRPPDRVRPLLVGDARARVAEPDRATRTRCAPPSRRSTSREVGKVVLARDLVGTVPKGADLRRLARALAIGYPDCWTYAVDGIIGASPETLVTVSGGTVTARVLAGTAPRGADADADTAASLALATSAKDQDEHLYAVQSVLASLRPHTSALAASEQPFTLKLPNVFHLATDVEGELSGGASALDLIGALHPTAAVAGSPTDAAIEVIRRLEPFDRGRYAGPVGWVDAQRRRRVGDRAAVRAVRRLGRRRRDRGHDPGHGARRCGHRRRQRPGGRAARDPGQVPPDRGRARVTGAVGSLPPRGDAILTNLRLVDGIDPVVQEGLALVIADGVIRDIVPAASVSASTDAIDLGGAYVMPGLINMHTHFSLSLPGTGGDAVSALDPHELALYMADGARRTLLSGVTTVRCVAEKGGADFALRRAIAAGHVPGPRIFTAGRALALHRRPRARHRRHARVRRTGGVHPRGAQPGARRAPTSSSS